jgi:hypothetical protein
MINDVIFWEIIAKWTNIIKLRGENFVLWIVTEGGTDAVSAAGSL